MHGRRTVFGPVAIFASWVVITHQVEDEIECWTGG